METDKDALIASLKKENEYLKSLLDAHGIPFELPKELPSLSDYSIDEKIALYRSYFRGREDVYARGYINKEGRRQIPVIRT